MSWRDNLRPGSFRSVAFHTADAGLEGGRRIALHEYPGSESAPYPEDMGRQARRYSVEAYVIGDDYMDRRDALRTALEKKGAGPLVHHFHGELQVAVTGYSLQETSSEGRTARFSIKFVEAGANIQPSARVDTPAAAAQAADAATETAKTDLVNRFTTDGQPQFVAESGKEIVFSLSSKIEVLAAPQLDTVKRAALAAAVVAYKAEAAILTADPAALATRTAELIFGVSVLGESRKALTLLRRLKDFGDDLPRVPFSTLARRIQAANQDALIALVQRTVVAEIVRAASQTEFISRDEVEKLRDEVAELIDKVSTKAADLRDDLSYASLLKLRAAVMRDLSARGAELASLVKVKLEAELSTLVWAWELYEDISRADEIAARNAIFHPGFVLSGWAIEALIR